jgi:hypothetical protein
LLAHLERARPCFGRARSDGAHSHRAALGLLRDYSATADTVADVVPIVLELGYLTASGLATLHRYDRALVEACLAEGIQAADEAAAGIGDAGARADLAAVDVAMIAAEVLWVPDRDAVYPAHAERAARRLWIETRTAGEQAAEMRHQLCWPDGSPPASWSPRSAGIRGASMRTWTRSPATSSTTGPASEHAGFWRPMTTRLPPRVSGVLADCAHARAYLSVSAWRRAIPARSGPRYSSTLEQRDVAVRQFLIGQLACGRTRRGRTVLARHPTRSCLPTGTP